ncbi:MAG TPA: hypothetical protein QGF58_07825 [Myxococcota bacterium]|nr:hypothetical protein [Myxococcota bacterium]
MNVREAIEALSAGNAPPSLHQVVSAGERNLVLVPTRAEVWLDGACIARLSRSHVGFRLMLIVATCGEELDRAALFEAVWEGQRYRPSSDNTLRVALSRLRKELGESLSIEGTQNRGLRLEPPVSVWVHQVDRGLQRVQSDLIGRGELVEVVAQAILTHRLVTLLGPGGIGKTSVARAVVDSRPDQWSRVVQLQGCGTKEEALCALAEALDLAVRGPIEDRVYTCLEGRAGLLVLDEAEGVDLADIVTALGQIETLAVLVTSRVPLGVEGEHRLPVPSLSVEDGMKLFDRRADSAGRPPRPEEREEVRELVERLGAHPLSLELVAARASLMPPRRLLERLSVDLLQQGPASLRAVLDGSWALLGDSARVLLARCSLFHGGFELDAAEAIADLGPEAPWVVELLQELHDHGWVQVDETGRFHLLELVRAYARQMLEDAAAAQRGWGDWLVDAGRAWVDGLDGRDSRACLDRLVKEQANLLALVRIGDDDQQAWAGVIIFALAVLRGNVPEPLRLVQRAREADGRAAPHAFRRGRLRISCAQLLRVRGFPDEALEELAAPAPAELAVEFDRARGQALQALGRMRAAEETFRRGLDAAGDLRAKARAQEALGVFLITVERLAEAEDELARAGSNFARAGDARGQARTQVNQADVLLHQGRQGRAEEVSAQALSAARACGDQVVEAYALANLGLARLRLGRPDPEILAEALVIARAIGDKALAEGIETLGP